MLSARCQKCENCMYIFPDKTFHLRNHKTSNSSICLFWSGIVLPWFSSFLESLTLIVRTFQQYVHREQSAMDNRHAMMNFVYSSIISHQNLTKPFCSSVTLWSMWINRLGCILIICYFIHNENKFNKDWNSRNISMPIDDVHQKLLAIEYSVPILFLCTKRYKNSAAILSINNICSKFVFTWVYNFEFNLYFEYHWMCINYISDIERYTCI